MNDPSAIFEIIHSLVSQPESRLSVSEMCRTAGVSERILTLFWNLISGAGIQKVQKEFT